MTNGTYYVFSVRAVNSAGNGAVGVGAEVRPTTTPSAPADLKAVPVNSAIGLYWTQATGTGDGQDAGYSLITGYQYRQKTGSGEYSQWTAIVGSTATTGSNTDNNDDDFEDPLNDPDFKVTGLTNGETYQFQVRALNARGAGAASETPSVTIATVPGRPRSLAAVPGNGQVALSWVASGDGGSPITSWQFRLESAPDGTPPASAFPAGNAWVTIPGSDADTSSYTVVSLSNTMQYRFQVRAVNAVGNGNHAQSDFVNPGMPPGAPTALAGDASATSITLTWMPPLTADALNTGGSPITKYQYSQKTGDGDYGEWMDVPANALFSTTATDLTADGADRSLNPGDPVTPAALTSANGMGTEIKDLTPGTAYLFRVRAVNATGAGPAATLGAAVYPGTAPRAPANLNARPIYDAASGTAQIALSWASGGDGGAPITSWEYVSASDLAALATASTADPSQWVQICSSATDPTCASTTSVMLPRADMSDSALATRIDNFLTVAAGASGDQHFIVRAVNEHGIGFQSGTDVARFTATVPSAPPAVFIGSTTGTSVTLNWRASVDGGSVVTKYEYSAKVGDGSWSDWADTAVSDATAATLTYEYSVTDGTAPGTPHTFRIRAVNARGNGSHAESVAIVPGAPGHPGALDLTTDNAPRLMANPGTTEVTLDFTGTTGNVVSARWEYSYKVGDGDWGGWLYAGEGGNFDPTDINPSNPTTGNAIDGLQNGVAHQFRIRALNGQLSSPILESNTVIPGVAPPAPQGLNASGGDQSVTLSWTSGGSGGPPITRWEYCEYATQAADATTPTTSTLCGDVETPEMNLDANPANDDFSSVNWRPIPGSGPDTTSHTIGSAASPLTNGTSYTYLVRAVNAIGHGARAQSTSATPGKAPAAPARALLRAGDGQVTITVDGPSPAPAVAVTSYEVRKSQNGGPYDAWEALGSGDNDGIEATVTGLINGSSYTFQVRAVNAFGSGDETTSQSSATPTGAPTANMLAADPGDGQVALSWNPLSSGGSTIIKWQYRQSESGGGYGAWTDIADSGPATTSHTVTGLSNGISYAFEVRGVNVNLEMVNAEPITSAAVMPSAVPPAPSVSAARGNGQVDLTWTAGTSGAAGEATYAAPTTGWQVRTDDGAWVDVPDSNADTTSHSVTGLTNGTAYSFEVRAVNSQGGGAAGSAGPVTPATTPSAPTVSADRGDGSTGVSWTAGDNGGSAVTGWQLQANDGAWMDIAADTTSVSVDTDDGTAYTFNVRGVNDVGAGDAGSASVEAGSVPAAPEVSAERGDGQVSVSWTAGDNGGSTVTGWQVQVNDGDWTAIEGSDADTSSHTVTGLDNGTEYTIGVRAANGVGDGAAGSASATPATTPSAPEVSATGGNGMATVSWTAGDDGGSAVTSWHVQVGDGEWTDVGADASSHTVGDLSNGTSYTFSVRAVNDVGEGAAGSASATPATTPAEPTVSAAGTTGEITVSWTAGDDGGSAVTGWQYRMKFGSGDYGDWNDAAADATSVTISGLDTGTGVLTYTFQVRAVNGVGAGDAGTSNEASPARVSAENGVFYTGVITGPDYCTQLSLGGAHLLAHDGDGDGVADVCSLPYTRREAIARQGAVDALAVQNAGAYAALVNAACAMVDMVEGEDNNACGGDMLADPPAIPINDGGPFYSGVISGPNFCANLSLGGPTTYPHDNDKDGVADVCALPYTLREAIARQVAGDTLAAMNPADFRRELASACRALTGGSYGDDADDLARDACA